MERYFDFYRIGQFNGQGPVLWMLKFLAHDGGYGGCQCIEEGKLNAMVAELERQGWVRKAGRV